MFEVKYNNEVVTFDRGWMNRERAKWLARDMSIEYEIAYLTDKSLGVIYLFENGECTSHKSL